jgi:hypothetical protein
MPFAHNDCGSQPSKRIGLNDIEDLKNLTIEDIANTPDRLKRLSASK